MSISFCCTTIIWHQYQYLSVSVLGCGGQKRMRPHSSGQSRGQNQISTSFLIKLCAEQRRDERWERGGREVGERWRRRAAGDTGIGQGHSGRGSCSTAALQHGWSRCSLATAVVMAIWGGNCGQRIRWTWHLSSPGSGLCYKYSQNLMSCMQIQYSITPF